MSTYEQKMAQIAKERNEIDSQIQKLKAEIDKLWAERDKLCDREWDAGMEKARAEYKGSEGRNSQYTEPMRGPHYS